MAKAFTYEGYSIYYEGEHWVAVNPDGIQGTDRQPLTRRTTTSEGDQSWAAAVTTQIRARIEAGEGEDLEPPAEVAALLRNG